MLTTSPTTRPSSWTRTTTSSDLRSAHRSDQAYLAVVEAGPAHEVSSHAAKLSTSSRVESFRRSGQPRPHRVERAPMSRTGPHTGRGLGSSRSRPLLLGSDHCTPMPCMSVSTATASGARTSRHLGCVCRRSVGEACRGVLPRSVEVFLPVQLPRMLIARDATTRIVASEIKLSNIISSFARGVIGNASVGLNAVAVQKARKR